VILCLYVRMCSEFLVQPFRVSQDETPAHTHEDEEEVVPMQVRGQDVIAIYRQKDGERLYSIIAIICFRAFIQINFVFVVSICPM
jgi:hypothetical protein